MKKWRVFLGSFAACFGFACFVAWLAGYDFDTRGGMVAYMFCVGCIVCALVANVCAEVFGD